MNILEINSLSYTPYSSADPIIHNINLQLSRGNVLGITGESGSGKTTLIKVIAGVIKHSSGSIRLTTSNRQLLFQNNEFIINPYRTINNIIEEALQLSHNISDIKAEKERLLEGLLLERKLWNKKGFELSGGERQRAALARVLAVKPDLLLLDEPFSAQDLEAQEIIISHIKQLKEYNTTIICVSHNINLLTHFADDLCIMYNGKIVESGPPQIVTSNPKHDYTKFLIKAGSLSLGAYEINYKINNE